MDPSRVKTFSAFKWAHVCCVHKKILCERPTSWAHEFSGSSDFTDVCLLTFSEMPEAMELFVHYNFALHFLRAILLNCWPLCGLQGLWLQGMSHLLCLICECVLLSPLSDINVGVSFVEIRWFHVMVDVAKIVLMLTLANRTFYMFTHKCTVTLLYIEEQSRQNAPCRSLPHNQTFP